jgi:hypothetical protein
MLLTLKTQKSHTPSITTVIITVYLKENGNKKKLTYYSNVKR